MDAVKKKLLLQTIDGVSAAKIDGFMIPYLSDYEIKTSAKGDAEVILKLKIESNDIKVLELATS